jgi:hypothetical protein
MNVYTVIAGNGLMYAFMTKRHAMRFMTVHAGCHYSERYTYDEYAELYEQE